MKFDKNDGQGANLRHPIPDTSCENENNGR